MSSVKEAMMNALEGHNHPHGDWASICRDEDHPHCLQARSEIRLCSRAQEQDICTTILKGMTVGVGICRTDGIL